jgi:hypothetical protein
MMRMVKFLSVQKKVAEYFVYNIVSYFKYLNAIQVRYTINIIQVKRSEMKMKETEHTFKQGKELQIIFKVE